MQRVFETFLERLSESVDEVDLRNSMVAAVGSLDLPTFAYVSQSADSSDTLRLISNYPTRWTSHYLRQHYEEFDPVILRARCAQCPFRWGPDYCARSLPSNQQQLFDEAAEFGIACGLTIPIHDHRGGFAALTFAAEKDDPLFPHIVERFEQGLQLMATCFHIEARRRLAGERAIDGIRLTPREFECLQWAARGKSARDIGSIIGVKRRTAAFHLDNARNKLGVRTIAQAVARFASSRPRARQ